MLSVRTLPLCLVLWLGTTLGSSDVCVAATRRAMLVGINEYAPQVDPAREEPGASAARRNWYDLRGAVNDVLAIREILVARHGFREEDILLLQDAEASREAIIRAFQAHLVEPASKGDVCVFYYAGHGSQAQNLDCPEGDCLDETIVPADANAGARDIRDKEWQRLFNDVLDRGAVLTVFFDSCHSGSISRGLASSRRSRFLAVDPRAAPPMGVDPRGDPSRRGALVFSAAQAFQKADETVDDQGTFHGLFSMTLIQTLRSMPVDESAQSVFARVQALMHSNGWGAQDPQLEGPPARLAGRLFAKGPARSTGTTLAVERRSREGTFVLHGGLALGLCVGSLLRGVDANEPPREFAAESVRLRVMSLEGLNRCTAEIMQGNADNVAAGDLLEIDQWSSCDQPFLRVWIPSATLRRAELERVAASLAMLRQSTEVHWVDDPTEESPTHVVHWDGTAWWLSEVNGAAQRLGQFPTAAAVLERLPADRPRLFLHLPPPSELAIRLGFAPGNPKSPIEATEERAHAHYLLAGRVGETSLEYAWVLPDMTSETAMMSPIPTRTDWCELGASTQDAKTEAEQLADLALHIGKARRMLQLEPPPDDGRFPYRLVLTEAESDSILERTTLYDGESFRVALHGEPHRLQRGIQQRFVYVFAIDSYLAIQSIFPRQGEDNYLPYLAPGSRVADSLIVLGSTLRVGEPYGIDTFVLLTTLEPISEFGLFKGSPPVRTRGEPPETPLSQLLADIDSGTRGIRPLTPVNWSLQRLSVRSARHKGAH